MIKHVQQVNAAIAPGLPNTTPAMFGCNLLQLLSSCLQVYVAPRDNFHLFILMPLQRVIR